MLVHGGFTNDPNWPTVTVYNHLDVRQADDADWLSSPLLFTREGDRFNGRSATDDEVPALTALLGAVAARESGTPVNRAFLWELEEQIGSEHFADAVTQNSDRLKSDVVVISDTVWVTRGKPSSRPDCVVCNRSVLCSAPRRLIFIRALPAGGEKSVGGADAAGI